jgi:hypothetical protein
MIVVAPMVTPIVVDVDMIVLPPVVPLIPIVDAIRPMVRPVTTSRTIRPFTGAPRLTAATLARPSGASVIAGAEWSIVAAGSTGPIVDARSLRSFAALAWTNTLTGTAGTLCPLATTAGSNPLSGLRSLNSAATGARTRALPWSKTLIAWPHGPRSTSTGSRSGKVAGEITDSRPSAGARTRTGLKAAGMVVKEFSRSPATEAACSRTRETTTATATQVEEILELSRRGSTATCKLTATRSTTAGDLPATGPSATGNLSTTGSASARPTAAGPASTRLTAACNLTAAGPANVWPIRETTTRPGPATRPRQIAHLWTTRPTWPAATRVAATGWSVK